MLRLVGPRTADMMSLDLRLPLCQNQARGLLALAARPSSRPLWPAREQTRAAHHHRWRAVSILDDWVSKEARPISLRQLMVFGRSLNEQRLISSANYVRTELPRRLAHRIRDMQTLPYCVVANPHFNEVYELYYEAFDKFRKVYEIRTLDDNDAFCDIISDMLKKHLSVIPRLAMGILETSADEMLPAKKLDGFMNAILRSRISRRVIAEQHLSLTETFHSPNFMQGVKVQETDFIGKVFLKCNAADTVRRCGRAVLDLAQSAYGVDVALPEIKLSGHLDANFPFILSHMEYIVGELLRNSVQSVIETQMQKDGGKTKPPPIEVTICESLKHVVIRVSDQGGGISRSVLPYLWSFCKGPHSQRILSNLTQVPMMAATLQEVRVDEPPESFKDSQSNQKTARTAPSTNYASSLSSLTSRPPNLRLGMGLPLSRIYAEYWAGSLELQSLWGYGVDVFFQVSKLGNKNEQLLTRAMMDAV
ncbi:branched-chain alpha-ketoacid dehydrogenase [Coniella lustricola]|uniref:Protein-serine/threonine kinase n=1 Tax=Coniella lustricola TaxID=2025994 RepID=A0A2T3AJQ0_9PEZI|nr:branched-chain alpha-ketoacid dehydrogenase [Coniella lustricola]